MTEIVKLLSPADAQRLTQRIKLTASSVRDNLFKLRNLITEARESNAWQVLGFASWPAYLVDALGDEPLRVSRDERQQLVGYLAGEGLSTRAIAPIVGVDRKTVERDIAGGTNVPPAADTRPDAPQYEDYENMPAVTRDVTGLDGKTYERPVGEAKKPARRPLVDQARDAGWELRRAMERLERIGADDRLSRNRDDVAAHLRGHLTYAQQAITDLLHLIEEGTQP